MKVCIGNEQLINEYIDGRLSPEQERELLEHMKTCPACREYYDQLCFISGRMIDIDFPENLHRSIMEAVENSRPKGGRLIRFKRPAFIGAVAAAAVLIVVGAAGLRQGMLKLGPSNEKSEDMFATNEMTVGADIPMMADCDDLLCVPEAQAGDTGQKGGGYVIQYRQPIQIETRMSGWFKDASANNFTVKKNEVSGDVQGREPENEPSEGDDRIIQLASRLGDEVDGYGFYIIAYGSVEELADVFYDYADDVTTGMTLLVNVKNDPSVREEIGCSMTESGFEIYEDNTGVYFSNDEEADEGLVIVELVAE